MSEEHTLAEADLQLVIFRLRDEEFGVEINQVREIVPLIDITPIPVSDEFIIGVINLRGEVIPVIDLARQFGLPVLSSLPKTARIVVIEARDNTVGMIVDEVPHVLKLSASNIELAPEIIQKSIRAYIKGVGKLEDRLIILLDLSKVFGNAAQEAK